MTSLQSKTPSPGPDGPEQDSSGRGESSWKSRLKPLARPVPLITLTLAGIFLFLLGLLVHDMDAAAPPEPHQVPGMARAQARMDLSELYPLHSLESGVHTVDSTLLQVLGRLGVHAGSIQFLDVRRVMHNGEPLTVQTLHLPESISSSRLQQALEDALPADGFTVMRRKQGEVQVMVRGVPTHTFVGAPPPYLPSVPGPKVVVVIDDMGENMAVAQDLAGLSAPVVFAIWPNASHAAQARALAMKHGLDILVHLPMEPLSYPENDPGKEALFVSMSNEALQRTIQQNLDKVPEAVGVNNHMGSRFTRDLRGMRLLTQTLKQRRLFFLDSRTTSKSVGQAAARESSLPFYGRDIFLDNSLVVQDIFLQLKKTERLAKRNGVAIAIGHPHPETAQALRSWLAQRDPAVSVVSLTTLAPQ